MSTNSHLFRRAPRWLSHRFTQQPPPALIPWLFEYDSLTVQMRQRYGERFSVSVLFETQRPAFIEECQHLNVPASQHQRVREVTLMCDDRPMILARTIIPPATLQTAHRKLNTLGSRPLGEVLFSYRDLERRSRQICRVTPELWSPTLRTQLDLGHSVIWGRRTLYAIHQQPLLVAEFFLDALLKSDA